MDARNTAEVIAYAAAARRGDVLPVCFRLTAARADAEWSLRLELVREVGPACPQASLDRACNLMPDAPELRLLRAARSLAIAAHPSCNASLQSAWVAYAKNDLVTAAGLDPMDATARCMLADLVGVRAWAAHTQLAA